MYFLFILCIKQLTTNTEGGKKERTEEPIGTLKFFNLQSEWTDHTVEMWLKFLFKFGSKENI